MAEEKRRITINKLPRKYRKFEKQSLVEVDKYENSSESEDIDVDEASTSLSIKKKVCMVGLLSCLCALSYIAVFIIVPMYTQPKPVHTNTPQNKKFSIFTIGNPENKNYKASINEILPQMRELYSKNSDITGWLKIDDTVIDYPVMYTPWDGEFYLYRTFEKENDPTKQGCLFIDPYNSLYPRDANLIIYGHNMKNGTMFNSLLKYEDVEYYKKHSSIEFNTLDDEGIYDIISVFKSKVYNQDEYNVFKFYRFYDAYSQSMFDDFIKNIKELQLYNTGIDAEYGDELLTLVTCDERVKNGRFVVVAKKRK